MLFNLFIFSNFFLIVGVVMLLAKDSIYLQNKAYVMWPLSVSWLSLPLLWLCFRDSFLALTGGFIFTFRTLHTDGTWLVSPLGNTTLFIWQKSVILACILPTAIFFVYLLTKPSLVRFSALNALGLILISGFIFTITEHLFFIFLSFELLLLSSLFLLRLTAKSERIGEAVTEMFFWTLVGSLFLFLGFMLFFIEGHLTMSHLGSMSKAVNVASFMYVFGFGVKLPLWPCFSWLLKAHVEASVEFSILLSGVIVKFGALGIFRFINQSGFFINSQVLALCSLLGVVEASLRLLAQRDIKRIVALTTVIELNWVGFCIAKGGLYFDQLGAYLLVAHSFTTSSEFFLVECIYKRYHTRDFFFISGVANNLPTLWIVSLLSVLVTIGFPGTSLFTAKLLFFGVLSSFSFFLFILFMFFFLFFIPIFFVRLWVPVWFGTQPQKHNFDLTAREILLFCFSIGGSILIGLCPTLVLDFV